MADVTMPQLGETVTEGTITRWLKGVGDPVERDEPLFEVSTDKVDSEVPAPASGTLAEIRVAEGDTVDVGTVLAVIVDGVGSAAPAAPSQAARDAASAAPAPAAPAPSVPPVSVTPPAAPAPPAPVPAAPPAAAPVEPAPPAPVIPEAASSEVAVAGVVPASDRVLSPVVRRLLDEHGIDAAQLRGTGVGGRITRADVLSHIDAQRAGGAPSAGARPAAAPAARASAAPDLSGSPTAAPPEAPGRAGVDEVVPFTNIRRRTAEHMVRSKATSPHALVVVEADFEGVERVRRAAGPRFKSEEGFSLTYLPFIARATVEALAHWPKLNASVGDDALIVHHQVNLGIAVDLDHQGLIVPVVHRAEELTLRGLARRIRDVADRARTKKLSADDIAGGTFSITNPGPFGTLLTFPVINQPQVAILSTDGVKRAPVVVTDSDGGEAVAVHSVGLLSLAWDHRAVDGAYAAAFVREVAEVIATHDWSTEV